MKKVLIVTTLFLLALPAFAQKQIFEGKTTSYHDIIFTIERE